MHGKTPDKLRVTKRHPFFAAIAFIIFVAKRGAAFIHL